MAKILTFRGKKTPENKGEVNFARFAKRYLPDDYVLVTTPEINNVEVDYLLFGPDKFLVIEIKYWLGVIVENPFGKWKIIYGNREKSEYDPFYQAQRERKAVNKFIYDKFGLKFQSKCLILNMAQGSEFNVTKRQKNFILFQYKSDEALRKLLVEGNFGKVGRDLAAKLKKNFLSYWGARLEPSDPDLWSWDCFSNNKIFICLHPKENREISEQNNDAILSFIRGYTMEAIANWERLLYSETVSPLEKSFIITNLAYAYYRTGQFQELVKFLYTYSFKEEAEEFREYLDFLLALAYFKLGGKENLEKALNLALSIPDKGLVPGEEKKKLLFNIYAGLERWEDALKVIKELAKKGDGAVKQRLKLVEEKISRNK